jgi:GTP pyrophosphokinase
MADIKEIASLLQNPTEADVALIQKAAEFAERAHAGQKRLSGEPYFSHCFATAKNLAGLNMSATTVAAGLLHDTVEDAKATPQEIEKQFGKEILFLVEGVTKLGKIKYHGIERHSESLRKFFMAMSQDIRVLIIKLCDRLHNMETLQFVPKEKQIRIATETLEIYAPLSYRLGIRKIQRSLEDIAFSFVYPEDYEKVKDLLKIKLGESEDSLQKFQKSLKKDLAQNNIVNFKTDYRVKGLYSLYKKLKRNDMDIEKIYDISAVRVIVPTVEECYKILGIIHGAWKPLTGRIKDYISTPKPNGYQSLHTTVFSGDGNIIEVQIRTREMHEESEYGIASHIFYKQAQNEKTQNGPRWIKDLIDYQKKVSDNEFLENIKTDFFGERIFVFTPKGDCLDLPAGSSAIDFAFNIHSDIGNHISGAKINGKFTALSTVLQSGDMVEIETKKTSQPSRKWLDYCKTTLAKRHIRNALENKNKSD